MSALCGSVPIVKGSIVYHFGHEDTSAAPQDQIAYVTFESQRTVLSDGAFYQARWNSGVDEDALSVAEYLSERGIANINPFCIVTSHSDQKFAARRQAVTEQLELGALLARRVTQLSNGERRRVLIARALLKSPRLIILDNPFAGLDEHFRTKLGKHLDNLMQGDLRVMIVGTNRDEIPSGITHILYVKDGQLKVAATTAQSRPPSASVRAGGLGAVVAAVSNRLGQEPPRKTLVSMKNVNVSYNGTKVLGNVNWIVRENEQWALLGPNGAGKTTLLSLILADNPQAYANDITLFGRRRGSGESIWEIKQKIGWVAPELHLYYPRNTTCLDVVCSGWFDSVGLYRQCSAKQRETAVAWLHQLGLADCAEKTIAQVSEGEQRLALIARALVKSPTLLVLDEPCQGLDASNRDRVLQAIDWVGNRTRASIIYVTHRADELPQSITHVLRLNEGQVVDQTSKRN